MIHWLTRWWRDGSEEQRQHMMQAEAELRKEVERHTEVSKHDKALAERQREDTIQLIDIAERALRSIRRGQGDER